MNESVPTAPSVHAEHDAALVAVLAARPADLSDAEAATARDLVASCTGCADLLADLVTVHLAQATTPTPRRPRDFTISAADAERLRSTGWRRALGFFGSARDGFTRPLAAGLTTLGIVGLLVATVPSIAGSGGASATLSTVGAPVEGGIAGGAPAASAAPSAAAAAPSAAAPAPSLEGEVYATERVTAQAEPGVSELDQESTFSGAGEAGTDGGRDVAGDGSLLSVRDDGSGLSVLFVVAGVMLIAGLGLFLLRWTARRLT
jgi:hypothetical protein